MGGRSPQPVRKVYYNIAITGLSVAVALFIGTVELVGLLTHKLSLRGPVADWFQHFNINTAGFVIVGMFVVTWTVALAVWRFAKIEEKWAAGLELGAARSAPAGRAALGPRRSERRPQRANQRSGAVGAAPPGPWVRSAWPTGASRASRSARGRAP